MSSFEAFNSAKLRMEAIVFDAIVPEAGAILRSHLADFTRNAGELTTLGVLGLAIVALFLFSKIENTLNQIWRVDQTRPILMRIVIFWAILTFGPLLIGATFSWEPGVTALR